MSESPSSLAQLRRPTVWIPIASGAMAIAIAAVIWTVSTTPSDQAAAAPSETSMAGDSEPPASAETGAAVGSDAGQAELLPGVPFPGDFSEVEERTGETVGQSIVVTRFQDAPEVRLGGEQISVARTPDGGVLGYVDFRLPPPDAGELPSAESAERMAFDLLDTLDAEYAAGLTVQWVQPHEETVLDASGVEQTIPGMKVKTIHDNGRYTWLIYGADNRLVAYERDMPWDGAARVTGVWLEEREGVDGPR